MEILEAFDLTRCAHSAAELAGVDEKTVARYVAVRDTGRDRFTRARRRRAVAEVKAAWKAGHRRKYRPWVPEPGMWRFAEDDLASICDHLAGRRGARRRGPLRPTRHERLGGVRPVTSTNAPAIPDELDRILRRMRLPYLRKAAPDVLATATRSR